MVVRNNYIWNEKVFDYVVLFVKRRQQNNSIGSFAITELACLNCVWTDYNNFRHRLLNFNQHYRRFQNFQQLFATGLMTLAWFSNHTEC